MARWYRAERSGAGTTAAKASDRGDRPHQPFCLASGVRQLAKLFVGWTVIQPPNNEANDDSHPGWNDQRIEGLFLPVYPSIGVKVNQYLSLSVSGSVGFILGVASGTAA